MREDARKRVEGKGAGVELFIKVGLPHDVKRAVLGFKVRLGEVLPHDAEAQQLHAADEDDDRGKGGPAVCRGVVGKTLEKVLGRDFAADGPWEKMGADITEFRQPWGKAYLTPAFDFGSCEIAAWSISRHPDMAQQKEMLGMLLPKIPEGKNPIMHSDMGRQYQHEAYCTALREAGVVQSMSRKGSCLDNGATEKLFGHMKDEFFRGQSFESFEELKEKLEEYIVHWNTRRRQVRLKGLTPGGVPEPVPSGLGRIYWPVQVLGRSSSSRRRGLSFIIMAAASWPS